MLFRQLPLHGTAVGKEFFLAIKQDT